MSTSGAYFGLAYNFTYAIPQGADPTSFFTGTFAIGEVKVSRRTGSGTISTADIATLPVPGSTGLMNVALSTTEMQADEVTVEFIPVSNDFAARAVSIVTSNLPTPSDVLEVNSSSVTGVADFKADVSGLATATSISDLNDFNPATDTVANVTTTGTVTDKAGYSLSQAFPANFADLTISATTGRVDVANNNDKTGYTLSQAFPANFSTLIIGTGADAGKVTTSNPAAGSGSAHTAQDVANLILATPANKLATDASGNVEANNMVDVSGLATQASVDTVDTEVGQIKAKTDQLTFTVANQVDSNALTGGGGDDAATIYTYFTDSTREDAFKADVSALSTSAEVTALPSAADVADAVWDEQYGDHTDAGTFGKLIDIFRKATTSTEGTVAGSPTATAFDTNLTMTNDNFNDQLVVFTSGPLLGVSSPIADTAATNGRITLQEPLPSAPSASDEFIILSDHIHPVSEIQAGLASQSSVDTVSSNVDTLVSNQGDITITTAQAQAIADEVLKRSVGNVEGATLDEHSLATIVLAILESQRSGSTWSIYRTDGATVQATKTLFTDNNAQPVVRVQ